MKVLDLFSGIGGFSLGLERAGMETVAFCEIEEFPQKVLKKHWPRIPILNDVKEVSYNYMSLGDQDCDWYMGPIDVICGGFPCQDISVAGKKKGIQDGTRSGLWFEFKRLIKEISPKYVIIENVANLRSNGLSRVIQDLWEIGYVGEWHIISARSVGACHLRERIWIIAYPDSKRLRDEREWGPQGQAGIQDEPGIDGTEGSPESADTNCQRLEGQWKPLGVSKKQSGTHGISPVAPDTDHLRLWKPFATEEEKSQWWAEATACFRPVFGEITEVEPTICGDSYGLPIGLDRTVDRFAKEQRGQRTKRVKALGNTIVPQIAELIGKGIMSYEQRN